jgi:2-polyprenyl-3-methyl-5-hydroxy-6-metoxy-1,4-benzoquinol methylase
MDSFDPVETFNDDYLWFYEPTLTDDRSRREASEIAELLALTPGASILDAPCGHGRISNWLAADGFEVTGVDRTGLFLDRARKDAVRLGVDVDYHQGDLRALPVSGPFDSAVCWFTSFGYFDDDDNRLVLRQFADVLRPGGALLIETMHHDGFVRGFTSAPATIVTERGDDSMTDVTTFNSVLGRVETERTVRRGGEVRRSHHSVRLPTVPEFDEWLRTAGFSARNYSERGGAALRFDSRRLVVVATR